jgi:hypothetical protein
MGLPRRLRSVLLAALLLGLAAVGGILLVRGSREGEARRALRAALKRQAAAGWGASYRDLLASVPPGLDAARQARAWAWMLEQEPTTQAMTGGYGWGWALHKGAKPPASLVAARAGFRTDARALDALLREGPCCLTSLGWLRDDAASADRVPLSRRNGGHVPNFLRLVAACGWWGSEALLAADPGAALDALDRLQTALRHPGCLFDAAVARVCAIERDRTFLVLAMRGDLQGPRLDAWLDEPAVAATLMAEGMRGDRLRIAAPLARDLAEGASVADAFGEQVRVEDWHAFLRWRVEPFLHGCEDALKLLEGELAGERVLRGNLDAARARDRLSALHDLHPPFESMHPWVVWGLIVVAASREAEHRMLRAAAALVRAAGPTGDVPPDEAAARKLLGARARLLDATPSGFALRYVRPAPERFRLDVDPTSGGSALIDAAARARLAPDDAPARTKRLLLHSNRVEVALR